MGPTQYTVEYDPSTRRYYLVDQNGQRNVGPGYREGFDSQNDAREAADEENTWAQRGYETPDPRTGESQADRDAAQRERDAAARADADDPEAARERMDRGESRSNGLDYGPSTEEIPQWVKDTRGIPLAGGPADAWMAEYEARQNERGWDALSDYMPTPDDLAVEYEQDPGVAADWDPERAGADADAIAAQDRALEGLREVVDGQGYTAADRARMQLGEMEVGRSMRATREADLAAMQARGMGGSGAEMASMLGAQQAGADALFARDADIQVHAEDRAMDALAGLGSLGSQQRGQSFDESAWNAQTQNDYNRWNTDYERDRSRWNTEQRNASRESRSDARQQAYENRERVQAGKTNQWQSAAGGRRADQQRNDENAKGFLAGIGEAAKELFG